MERYDLSKETSGSIGAIVGTAVGAIVTKLVIDWLSEDTKGRNHPCAIDRHRK